MGAGRWLGVFIILIPMLAMPGVLLLLHAVIPFSFISRHPCLLKFKSLCILEQQPGLSCSLLTLSAHLSRTMSGTKWHLSYSGHCRPYATILTLFPSFPP